MLLLFAFMGLSNGAAAKLRHGISEQIWAVPRSDHEYTEGFSLLVVKCRNTNAESKSSTRGENAAAR